MSAKVHVHMQVSDLSKSREFYERFFGGDPVKVKPGYVKFLPEWAPVNLALSQGRGGGEGTIDHMGIQVDAPDTVIDRKSTRLNSSHPSISYAVFCLKKKKTQLPTP